MTTENTTTTTTTTTNEKKRRGRRRANKVAYRKEDSPLLTAWPNDWDSTKHKPLQEDDFAEEVQYLYWDKRVEVYTERLIDAKKQAELCRKFGGKETRKKHSQMERLQRELEKLQAELKTAE